MQRAIFTLLTAAAMTLIPAAAPAQLTDATSLYGVHWYGNPGNLSEVFANPSDVELMAPGRRVWALEITHVDAAAAPPWDLPSWWQSNYNGGVTASGKDHSLIYRMQPYWDRHVPHASDPFTLTDFANAAAAAATTMQGSVRVWQIGNEVNLNGENRHWGGASYNVPWTPTPEQYAGTYEAVRNAIHTVAPNTTPNQQLVLMQPNSPGLSEAGVRFMDSNEFLWRQIRGVSSPALIDGFALHSYAEPGGTNFGVDGFMDALREQMMVIAELGHHNKPVFITEFNKHMPNATEAGIGAQFVQAAFQALHNWNTGTGGTLPGLANQDIVSACWFVARSTDTSSLGADPWNEYSLRYWKGAIVSTDPNVNPWYGFQASAAANHPAGSLSGGGGAYPGASLWWEDDFNTLDTASPLPRWRTEITGTGSATISGGRLRLIGSTGVGGATIVTRGYVFGNFRAVVSFDIVDEAQVNNAAGEANFDIRIREGSEAYSLTFFTNASDLARRNRVILRRKGTWAQIGSYNQLVPGGIGNGDAFTVHVEADGADLKYDVYKTAGAGADTVTPAVTFTVNDSAYNVGWLRAGTYNMREARIDQVLMGGPAWSGPPAGVAGWEGY